MGHRSVECYCGIDICCKFHHNSLHKGMIEGFNYHSLGVTENSSGTMFTSANDNKIKCKTLNYKGVMLRWISCFDAFSSPCYYSPFKPYQNRRVLQHSRGENYKLTGSSWSPSKSILKFRSVICIYKNEYVFQFDHSICVKKRTVTATISTLFYGRIWV